MDTAFLAERTPATGGERCRRNRQGGAMRRILLCLALLFVWIAPIAEAAACVDTSRPDASNPALEQQRARFGFHDEEIVICSPGATAPTHLAARLWVPASCPGIGECPGVLIAHGFGFSKELTVADMYNAVGRGMYVLSYDVRGQGTSGERAAFLDRDDLVDQASVLAWLHREVRPTKVAAYGVSQGGWLALAAAIYNCGSARAATLDPAIPCDEGARWIDAIAPLQAPTHFDDDGTCSFFAVQAIAMSRANDKLLDANARCAVDGFPPDQQVLLDLTPGLDRIDVPVYLATGFRDRLVLPQLVTEAYEHLRARADDPSDPYDADVRLLISNDGHGDIGANFAALNDIFTWIERTLTGGPALREASVAIAQEWDADSFRLESAWPIPGRTAETLYLARPDGETSGALNTAPSDREPVDELRNLPVIASPPEAPFVGGARIDNTQPQPLTRLVYLTAPFEETMEVSGLPVASIFVSSANPDGEGQGQLHIALSEVSADGSVTEFARNRRGLRTLGSDPVEVSMPLTVSDHRIDTGNRLMLTITPSDALEALPARGADAFFVHHDARAPSSVRLQFAPTDRTPPSGLPPSGASFADDPLGTICTALRLPC